MKPAAQWKIGDAVNGRWEIHKILSGGMGTVYLVYDREWSEPFAVKTFRDDVLVQNPHAAARFVDEAHAWINLDEHENVVRARFVQQINGKPFLFLEYVSGGDLSAWIARKRLQNDVPLALRFAIQLCDGMVHANSKGIEVHRDIKPQNCLVTESGVLKVTDFGLAKALDGPSDAEKPSGDHDSLPIGLTGTGKAVGTCTHMAPEQFDDAKNVDTRADIYSFGITLFQMLTGNLPFRCNSWLEYAFLHKHQPMPQIKALDEGLNTILRKCLTKAPSGRYIDFMALRHELRHVYKRLTGLVAPAPKLGLELDAYSLVNKGVGLNQLGRISEALACYNQALSIDSTISVAWANKGNALAASGQHREALRCYDCSLRINPKLQQAWLNKAKAFSALGENLEAVSCCETAQGLDPNDDQLWYCKAIALSKMGQTQEAISSFERCLQLNPDSANGWFNMGAMCGKLRDYKIAIKCYERATSLQADYADAWFNKAHAHQSLKQYEASIDAWNHVISLQPANANAWIMKGAALEDLRQYGNAIDCFRNAERLGNPRAKEGIANCERKMGH